MKKSIFILSAMILTLTITGCTNKEPVSNENTQTSKPTAEATSEPASEPTKKSAASTAENDENNTSVISVDEAKEIALTDAKLNDITVEYIREKLDYDDGKAVYDLEFFYDNKEYDYEIDALSGEIIEKDFDVEDFDLTVKPSSPTSQYITAEKAKEIALSKAKLKENEVKFEKAERDEDDGRVVYELEFQSGKTEYDFEIDALTGDILDYDKDYDD